MFSFVVLEVDFYSRVIDIVPSFLGKVESGSDSSDDDDDGDIDFSDIRGGAVSSSSTSDEEDEIDAIDDTVCFLLFDVFTYFNIPACNL